MSLPLPNRQPATRPRGQFVVKGDLQTGVAYSLIARREGEAWEAYAARVIRTVARRSGDPAPHFVRWIE